MVPSVAISNGGAVACSLHPMQTAQQAHTLHDDMDCMKSLIVMLQSDLKAITDASDLVAVVPPCHHTCVRGRVGLALHRKFKGKSFLPQMLKKLTMLSVEAFNHL